MRQASMHPHRGLLALVTFLAPSMFGGASPAPSNEARPPHPPAFAVAAQATKVDQPAADTEKKGQGTKEKGPDVIFVPTPQEVVDKMLELAAVKKGDVLYDLGCGDGRIVVTAAKKFGVKATGIDIDPKRVREANENVETNKVGDRVTIRRADIFETDLSEASVVTLYLLPELNVRLMPQLKKLKPGSRIVSHDFDMRGARPTKVVTLRTDDDEEEHTVYLWIVPWEVEDQ